MFQCLRMYLGPLWHDFRHSSSRVTQAQREEGDSLAEASDVVPVLALVRSKVKSVFSASGESIDGRICALAPKPVRFFGLLFSFTVIDVLKLEP